jgi:hypothetical protein
VPPTTPPAMAPVWDFLGAGEVELPDKVYLRGVEKTVLSPWEVQPRAGSCFVALPAAVPPVMLRTLSGTWKADRLVLKTLPQVSVVSSHTATPLTSQSHVRPLVLLPPTVII